MSIEDIRRRLRAATPVPWKAIQRSFQAEGGTYDAFGVDPVLMLSTVCEEVAGCYLMVEPPEEADAEFIAHAPEDMERLLQLAEAVERWFQESILKGDGLRLIEQYNAVVEALRQLEVVAFLDYSKGDD